MKVSDFMKFEITNFTPSEIEATGANVADVCSVTIGTLQRFRTDLGKRIALLRLTTGAALAEEHPKGLAVDFTILDIDPSRDLVVERMIAAGFVGIGVYKNEDGIYSFHGDLRPRPTFWRAEGHPDYNPSDPSSPRWKYSPLFTL